ncbi:prepilin-type N-terminal cleavage/methylation domain-containing protein [Patescibacteria group bacterium]|nr:prepilin-type N-terminal cleavage/methylation domain-containing protein [Patescibacteria group bacterium]
MVKKLNKRGFTILELLVAIAVFLLFAIGVYGGIQMIFKIVYQSRMRIVETSILSEELEIVRSLPFESVGIVGGTPAGVLAHEKIINRGGVDFNIVTTVRNIDDPFDGTIGGSPNDSSPADYKLVEMSAICATCAQSAPVILSTIVAPKSLEGASQNGALFVHVFGETGQPISGANVHVQGGTTTIDDVTDGDGLLKIIDITPGYQIYNISAGKSGYSSDGTYAPSPSNPSPNKLPITVISQTVSEIFLSIDIIGALKIQTVGQSCSAIPGVSFSLHGDKTIGRDPDVYKFDNAYTTDGAGEKDLGNVEWDTYTLGITGTAYDIMGSTPMNPFYISPGLSQEVMLVLRPHTANSLLVKVKDAGTGLPLSDATVRLTRAGYYQSQNTGLGYMRQTDWSGGSGQLNFDIDDKYFADSGTIDGDSPAGDLLLKKSGGFYLSDGSLESSTFDLGAHVNLNNIIWEPLNQPSQCGSNPIRMQIATSDTQVTSSWNYTGPDGSISTYYTATSSIIWSGHNGNGNRYMRYKVFLGTEDTHETPTLSEVAFTFTNGCTPPGQGFFSSLSEDAYNLEVSRPGYTTNSGEIEVSGRSEAVVNLSPI